MNTEGYPKPLCILFSYTYEGFMMDPAVEQVPYLIQTLPTCEVSIRGCFEDAISIITRGISSRNELRVFEG